MARQVQKDPGLHRNTHTNTNTNIDIDISHRHTHTQTHTHSTNSCCIAIELPVSLSLCFDLASQFGDRIFVALPSRGTLRTTVVMSLVLRYAVALGPCLEEHIRIRLRLG